MSLTLLTGVPGSGKTTRLVELLQEAELSGRRVKSFFCSDTPGVSAMKPVSVHRLIASRVPGLTYPIDHFVTTTECAELLAAEPPGTLVAFEESQWFGRDIVPLWLDASQRGLDVVAATPSNAQLRLLEGHDYRETRFNLRCDVCKRRDAVGYVPGGVDGTETVSVCARCRRHAQRAGRSDLRRRLRALSPAPGRRVLDYPVEVGGFRTWRVVRKDVRSRLETLEALAHVARRDGPERRPSALVLGSGTGFFPHRLRRSRRAFFPVVAVDPDPERVAVARLADGFFQVDSNTHLALDYGEYFRSEQSGKFDLVLGTQRFTDSLEQLEERERVDLLARLIDATEGLCLLEVSRAPAGDWLRAALAADPGVTQVGELDDDEHSPSAVLVGVTAELVWWAQKELAALGGRCGICKRRFGRRRVPDVRDEGRGMVLACDRCVRRLRFSAWRVLRRRLRAQPPEPGQNVLGLPVELPGLRRWRAERSDAGRTWETLRALARIGGITGLGRPLTSLVLGCDTGFLCRHLDDWGSTPVVGVEQDLEALTTARIVEGYFRGHRVDYVHSDPIDYLSRDNATRFDLTYVSRSFAEVLEGVPLEQRPGIVASLVSRSGGVCVVELGSTVDKAWLTTELARSSAFARVLELEAAVEGAPVLLVAIASTSDERDEEQLAAMAHRCEVCKQRTGERRLPDVRIGGDRMIFACERCIRDLRGQARSLLRRRVRGDTQGKPAEFPVELRGLHGTGPSRADAAPLWENLQTLVRIAGLTELGRPLSALVLGADTGYLCRRLLDWGVSPVVGVEDDADRLGVAQVVDGYLRNNRATLVGSDPVRYVQQGASHVDLVYASLAFARALEQHPAGVRLVAVDALAAAARVCVFEVDRSQTGELVRRHLIGTGAFAHVVDVKDPPGGTPLLFATRNALEDEALENVDALGQSCAVCARRGRWPVLPDVREGAKLEPIPICKRCAGKLRRRARRTLAARLQALEPRPGQKTVEYPVEVRGVERWPAERDAEAQWEMLRTLVRISGLPELARALNALVLGCDTGFFCHRLSVWGFSPVVGVDDDDERLAIAELADGYLRGDRIAYEAQPYDEYLRATDGESFDVVYTSRSFTRALERFDGDERTMLVQSASGQAGTVCVFEADDPDLAASIRMTLEATGNYAKVTTLRIDGSPGSIVAAIAPALDPDGQHELDRLAYPALVARLQEVAERALPENAVAVVVSHGDDNLLQLDGRRGLHFPQLEDGTYAGYYPATSEDAIEQLEALHERGAGYLIVPAPQLWWLDHYAEFREHIERTGREVARDPAAVIYALDA